MEQPRKIMKFPLQQWAIATGAAAVGVVCAAAGIHLGDADDAPGAALLGILLRIGAVVFAVRIVLRKPTTDGDEG